MALAKQIHEYDRATALANNDILLVQVYVSPGVYVTKSVTYATLKAQLLLP